MKLRYWHVDAFADRPFTGNQAAVMPLDQWLPDETLLAIAEENNFAETAFVVRDATGESDWELRWFTPTMEIRLCGHATLASGSWKCGGWIQVTSLPCRRSRPRGPTGSRQSPDWARRRRRFG